MYPGVNRLAVRVSTTSNWNNGCDPPQAFDIGVWYHIAIVLELNLLQVFYNGVLVCAEDFGAQESLIETQDRQFGLPSSYQVQTLPAACAVCVPRACARSTREERLLLYAVRERLGHGQRLPVVQLQLDAQHGTL